MRLTHGAVHGRIQTIWERMKKIIRKIVSRSTKNIMSFIGSAGKTGDRMPWEMEPADEKDKNPITKSEAKLMGACCQTKLSEFFYKKEAEADKTNERQRKRFAEVLGEGLRGGGGSSTTTSTTDAKLDKLTDVVSQLVDIKTQPQGKKGYGKGHWDGYYKLCSAAYAVRAWCRSREDPNHLGEDGDGVEMEAIISKNKAQLLPRT